MAYDITINGIDRTADVLDKTVVIEDVINDKQNVCRFSMVDRSGNGIPSTDQEIVITNASGTRQFGGYILSVGLSQRSEGVIKIDVNCIDYVRLLDRNLVHKSYSSMTDLAIIQDVISTYCPGFGITTANVVSGVTIDQISFNYLQVSQVMRRICDLTGRNWYIDYSKDVHYFPLIQSAAPFNITATKTTYQINDSMVTAPTGVLQQDASFDVLNSWVALTAAANNQAGRVSYQKKLAESFVIYGEFFNGVSSGGADANWVWWGCSSEPQTEDAGAGYGGFLVAMDEHDDVIQIWFDGTLLSSVAFANLDNNTWRTLQIEVTGFTIVVKIEGSTVLTYNGTPRALGGIYTGFGARTGGFNNIHRCREFQVYDTVGSYDYYGLRINKDASQLKNRIYVRGGTKLSDTTTYSEKGDGQKRKFVLPDKPHNLALTVNGVGQSIGIKNIDTSGSNWYLNFQEKFLEQDISGTVLSTTDILSLSYKYDIPILVAVEDTTSITNSGVKEFAVFDKSISTTQAARDRASAELTDYANNIIEGGFSTYTAGFISGQYINITLSNYGISDNYLVQRVVSKSLGAGLYTYDISVASSKTMGIIRFLIELLEANKNLIELDSDEVVDELLSVQDSLLSDSLTEILTIDSSGPYFTWCTDSLQATPITRARWDLFGWG